MQRFLSASIALAVVGATTMAGFGSAAAQAPGAASEGRAPAPARLTDYICQRALDPPARAMSITAVMRPMPGTRRLQLRFQLLSRPARGATGFAPVSGNGLGSWISPRDPALGQRPRDVWIVNHPVADLAAGAYRFRVAFRWIGRRHRVIATDTRVSATCRQPELRSALRIDSITVSPVTGRPQLDRYLVVLHNIGRTAARSFSVELVQDGVVLAQPSIGALAAHTSREINVQAAKCSAPASIEAIADPFSQVDEFDRSGNSLIVPCPASPRSY
ncbi:MAG: CARDB domain-containing protein [Solirubrobacteraceae bacterium]